MQSNEKSHLGGIPSADASGPFIGHKPTLFEAAIHCAVLQEFGPLFQEVEAIRNGTSNGDLLDRLLSDVATIAITEIRDCPHPERRQLIGEVYLNELRFLTDQYDSMLREKRGANAQRFHFHNTHPGDGGTEQFNYK
jgi:hypothetical protein